MTYNIYIELTFSSQDKTVNPTRQNGGSKELFDCVKPLLLSGPTTGSANGEGDELGEISEAADATIVNGVLAVVAKGFKTRELKHRGNKRLKSVLEQRKKSRGSRKE
ncbi:hypothetical protein CJ030_MR1G028626 [Morella rubra]|uniref:Uncharacterized protein n=1 Tax=Morella rubra TaxID=262757 RepID=A0A6A1WJY1_9ROSI|nr:hypothetical protein CJ030_MR1G028626 [Morella rubra]